MSDKNPPARHGRRDVGSFPEKGAGEHGSRSFYDHGPRGRRRGRPAGARARGPTPSSATRRGFRPPSSSAARDVKYIQKHGLNCKNIDLEAARERGIPLGTQSLMRNATVAEQALVLMLCCERKTILGQKAVEAGVYREMGQEPVATSQWNIRPNWPELTGVAELFGQSVGIIGLGDIGMDIARRCAAFDMKIFYYQRTRHAHGRGGGIPGRVSGL